jgi:hypothetical protein
MKHLPLFENCGDDAFNASSPRFIASLLSTLCEFMQKSPHSSAKVSDNYAKAKMTKFFSFATEITEM